MAIKVCRICKRLQPQHKENCIYVGAVRYLTLLGLPLPPEPYIDLQVRRIEVRDEESEEITEVRTDPDVAPEDLALCEQLRGLGPQQLDLRPSRIVET